MAEDTLLNKSQWVKHDIQDQVRGVKVKRMLPLNTLFAIKTAASQYMLKAHLHLAK